MEINSREVTVNKSAKELFEYLHDVKNFEQLMPENISKFETIREDAFIFGLKGMPEIALEIKETTPYSTIILGAISDKIPFTLQANITTKGEHTSSVALVFSGEFNAMMAMMIKSPITKFIETLVSQIEKN